MLRRLLLLASLTALCASPAAADEVRLKNGDRITGKVIALAGGTLILGTPYGDVKLPWPEVTRLVVTEPILVTVGTAPAVSATIIEGGANAGLTATSGNTEVNNLRLDGNVVARAGANRYTADAAVTRAEDSGTETARNWNAGLKYDRFLTTRLFFNANTILTSDQFRDLDLRTAIGAGLGYQVINTPRVTLTADGGLGYVNENLASIDGDSYVAGAGTAQHRSDAGVHARLSVLATSYRLQPTS